jgi:hypothetical protein
MLALGFHFLNPDFKAFLQASYKGRCEIWILINVNMLKPSLFAQVHMDKIIGSVYKHPFILKNGVFWDVTPCGTCKNRRFGGT